MSVDEMRLSFAIATLMLIGCGSLAAQAPSGWKLLWSDEFNGPRGQLPDSTKWTYDLGGGGWGNSELETYTNSTANVFQDGQGNLIIRAIQDSSGNYTSARIKTEGLFSFTYGRAEARIKLPFGQGIWPAFWILGTDIETVSWPGCGEVDIMENPGAWKTPDNPGLNEAYLNNGSVHAPPEPVYSASTTFTLPFGETVYDDYHVYAVEWSEESIQFLVDGTPYLTVTPSSITPGQWVFNKPFFLILNQAIGGSWPGSPDASTVFPSDLVVDYVRIYQPVAVGATTPVITPGRVENAASYLGTMAPGSLASLWGTNLADNTYNNTFSNGAFPTSVAGVSVTVNGNAAPLTYVGSSQINFQIPWETQPGVANVQVVRNKIGSNIEPVTIQGATAPSAFIADFTTGAVFATNCTAGVCTLWGNGFGPKNGASVDGVPATSAPAMLTPLETASNCALTIDGKAAIVDYCGASPGLIIDQLNFEYPSGLPSGSSFFDATLSIGGVTGRFRIPAPK